MKIVVLDHIYLQKEHVERLQHLGETKVFDEPPESSDELQRRIETAVVAIVGWSQLTEKIINSAKNLKMISIWATSCHYADLKAAAARRIVVSHVPAYATESVAEHVFALLLSAMRRLLPADKDVREGNFDWRPYGGRELKNKTLGVVGTGSIGFRVAEIAKAFGMNILGYEKYPNHKRADEIGLKYVDFPTLLAQSDVISLHVTLTPETEGMLGKDQIKSMKDGAVVINTSQGRIIDEDALIEALKSGKISCAGLDVFSQEPPAKDNPLFKLENIVLSPHIGFHTLEAVKRCTDICIDNVAKFLDGTPQNTC
ncbi:MAG TPA: 2-hydroxyacid dehydrogenase [Candidatus Eisenbacteria bacterium]|nr:2-hydroxyacid dehydrogenase [Candidatus Eisenbacteria bacterium]